MLVAGTLLGGAAVGAGALGYALHRRGMSRWLLSYVRDSGRRRDPRPGDEVHLLFCIADHYEPKQFKTPPHVARSRVERWVRDYPRQFARFRDSDGQPPRHTFFYPEEEYDAAYLDALAGLCHAGFGEVEIHLHHHDDTADNLRRTLLRFKEVLSSRHGLLPRRRDNGELKYGFVHGNWALDNSRPDGRHCGVNNEIDVLLETGCYADFTLPSAPSLAQTSTINRIYYAIDDPQRPKSHNRGVEIGTAPQPSNSLLLIQGPLVLDWQRRKFGLIPKTENACLQASQPPSIDRLPLWLRAHVQVPGRPDWFFVKLHAHGAAEESHETLLGEPMVRFHEALAQHADAQPNFHYHYVSAREMYNLARAAEAGWKGSVAEARDFELLWPDGAATGARKSLLAGVVSAPV